MPRKRKQKTRFSELTRKELQEVIEEIGAIIVKLPVIAEHARHKRPLNTFIDYVHGTERDSIARSFAIRFMKDFFQRPWGMSTEDLLEKWYSEELIQSAAEGAALAPVASDEEPEDLDGVELLQRRRRLSAFLQSV